MIHVALTTLARNVLASPVLVDVRDMDTGEVLRLIDSGGEFAAVTVTYVEMLEWSGSVCALRRHVLRDLVERVLQRQVVGGT